MAKRFVVIKGQPYRFGVVDSSQDNDTSILVRFASEPSVDQLKSVSPISVVPIEKAYVSPSLTLAMLLASRSQDILRQLLYENIWISLCASKPVVLLANRSYMLQRLRQELFDSRTDIEFNKAKLESRKVLRDIEAAWRTSILMPKVVSLLLRSEGWNNRVQKLFVEPYQPLPVGRITDKGTYQKVGYPVSASPANLSDGDDKLTAVDSGNGLVLVFVDDLSLPSKYRWPQVICDRLTPLLSQLLQNACVVVIDNVKSRHEYELALGRSLHNHKTSLGKLLPLQSSEDYDGLSGIAIDTFLTGHASTPTFDPQLSSEMWDEDYSSFADVFSSIFPDCDDGNLSNSFALRNSLKIFEAESFLQERVLLNFGYKQPIGPSDTIGLARLLLGLMPPLIHSIYERTSRILMLQAADLCSILPAIANLSQNDCSKVPSELPEYVLLSIDSDSHLVSAFDSDSLLSFLRAVRSLKLENPYRLEKKLSDEQRSVVERYRLTSKLLVVILS